MREGKEKENWQEEEEGRNQGRGEIRKRWWRVGREEANGRRMMTKKETLTKMLCGRENVYCSSSLSFSHIPTLHFLFLTPSVPFLPTRSLLPLPNFCLFSRLLFHLTLSPYLSSPSPLPFFFSHAFFPYLFPPHQLLLILSPHPTRNRVLRLWLQPDLMHYANSVHV